METLVVGRTLFVACALLVHIGNQQQRKIIEFHFAYVYLSIYTFFSVTGAPNILMQHTKSISLMNKYTKMVRVSNRFRL